MAEIKIMKGHFISLDGTEGAGKSTQLHFIRQWCALENIDAIFTREPGGTAFGEKLREDLLYFSSSIHPVTELLILLAARREHLETVILPALQEGKWVITDRFSDATYAYQYFGRGISLQVLQQLEKLSGTDIMPDLRFILGVSPDTATARLQKRGQIPDRFERENREFFERVTAGYRERANNGGIWIDCEGSPEVVFSRIRPYLDRLK